MSDSYGFTTTHNDVYINRVAEEAKPDTNVIVMYEKDTLTGETNVLFLIRREVLEVTAHYYPELPLGPYSFGELLLALKETEDTESKWAVAITPTNNLDRAKQILDRQVTRINNSYTKAINKMADTFVRLRNVAEDRTIRVNVDSY